MPLPDAEPTPNKANIYEQFSHIKVEDFTTDKLAVVKSPLFLNSQSEDVLRRIKLIGETTNTISTSGPFPNEGTIRKYIQTANNAGENFAGFRPPKNEVWEIMGISVHNTAALSGNQSYYFYYSSPETVASNPVPGANNDMFVSSINNASTNMAWETFSEDFVPRDILATHNSFPRCYASFGTVAAGEEVHWIIAYMVVR